MASQLSMGVEIVDVARLPAPVLERLFEAEREAWRDRLGWDSAASPAAMARAVEWGAVRGAALIRGGRPTGYVIHQASASIARACGVCLSPADAPAALPLVEAAFSGVPRGVRIEGQLAAFDGQPALDAAFRSLGFAVEPREFLALDAPLSLARARRSAMRLGPLGLDELPGCARALVAAHSGGVEARINEAFRSETTALSYLRELVELGGCGRIEPGASSVVAQGARVAGFCLASMTSPTVGHVPQIAVVPEAQGKGLGAALLRHAIGRLRERGAESVTLSVSRANDRARGWYARTGFRPVTVFASYHRDRPPEL